MEEQARTFVTSGKIGGGMSSSALNDDNFISNQNIANMERLRDGDKALGQILEHGHDAVGYMQAANQDLLEQR